jgi:hypothetical protein
MKTKLPLFVLLGFTLIGCGPRVSSVQKKLTGSWTNEMGSSVVSSDGTYHSEMKASDGTIIKMTGTMIAKDGDIVDTLTSTTQTNVSVPSAAVWHHFEFSEDGRELRLIGNNGAVQATMRKVDK